MPEDKNPTPESKDAALKYDKAASDAVDPSKADTTDALNVVDENSGA